MMIGCPRCRQTLQAADDAYGKLIRCPSCQEVFQAQATATSRSMNTPMAGGPSSSPFNSQYPAGVGGTSDSGRKTLKIAIIGGGLMLACLMLGMISLIAYHIQVRKAAQPTAKSTATKKQKIEDKQTEAAEPVVEYEPIVEKKKAAPKPSALVLRDTDIVSVKARYLVYDPVRQLIYASVGNTVPQLGNSIVAIDPAQGQQVWSVPVGSDPGMMAISDNCEALWICLAGAGSIQKVDLRTKQAGPLHSLGNGASGITFAEMLQIMPGTTDTVVVSRARKGVSPRHDGVAVYDNGIARPLKTRDHTGANRITVVGPNLLFGYNNETTEFGLRRLEVHPNGINETKVYKAIGGFSSDIVCAGNRIYSTQGDVVDANQGTLIGKLPVSGPFAVDVAKSRIFYLANNRQIQIFDTDRLLHVGTAHLQSPHSGATDFRLTNEVGSQLILVGDAGVAYPSPSGVVIISRRVLP